MGNSKDKIDNLFILTVSQRKEEFKYSNIILLKNYLMNKKLMRSVLRINYC